MSYSMTSLSTVLIITKLLLLSHDCHSFVTKHYHEQTSACTSNNLLHHHQLFAVPPQSPWDELKSRLGGNDGSSEKYSEGKAELDYRPTYEITDDEPELSMDEQRIESAKALVVGALVGSISVAPLTYFHYSDYSMAQFELATDMAAIQAGLFAITYRYVSRKGDNNPMLSQGAVGGEPLGYFDWNMIYQAVLYGAESFVMFGVTAAAMELAYEKNLIRRFSLPSSS